MIELGIIKPDEIKEWNGIVRESPYGTIFHTLEWMEILEKTFEVEKLQLGIYKNNELVGVFPAFSQRKGIFKLITSPLREAATPYGGPIIKECFLKDVTLSFDKFTKNIDYVDVTFSPEMNLNDEILSMYNYEERFTYILNLDQKIDYIWKNLNKKCRNMVRKAEKNDVEIIEGDKKGYLEEYYKMVEDTYKKSNIKLPIPMKYYKTLFEVLYPDKLKILFAKYDGIIIAGAIFPHSGDRIYYWDGASYRKYNKVAPNNLIQWHLIQWAVENGFKVYDMIGANIPSISKFKASFGGDGVRYFYVYKFNSVWAKYGRKAYVWWRKSIRNDLG